MKKFMDTIIEDATQQKNEMLQNIEEEKCNRIKQAEEEILHNVYFDIKKQISEIKNSYSRDLSKKSLEIRNELILKRDEISSEVFSKLKAKLDDFTKKSDYTNYLKNILLNLSSDVRENYLEITVAFKDLELVNEICKELKLNAKVKTDEDIEIGGFIVICSKKAFKLNETLDEKLVLSKEYFSEISGLVLS